MTVYFEDSWIEDDPYDPKQEETVMKLRDALLKKDFQAAHEVLKSSIQTPPRRQ